MIPPAAARFSKEFQPPDGGLPTTSPAPQYSYVQPRVTMFTDIFLPWTEAGWHAKETMSFTIKPKKGCRWDLISLGEVMLRFDPGEYRIWTTRDFRVSEGGGEYNVARGLKRCFELDTPIVTAFANNPIGLLLQDLIYQ